MDSDDEFDLEVDEIPMAKKGSKLVNGLNMREFVEKGGGSFEVSENSRAPWDGEEDDDELRVANMVPRRRQFENVTAAQLKVELHKSFLSQDFSQLKINNGEDAPDELVTFEEISRAMENVTPDGGVKKRVLVSGWGGKIQPGQVVYLDYLITYESGDETMRIENVVDTNSNPAKSHHQPFRFKVGVGNVIPVFDLGVATMELNEVAQFLATSQYAYGKMGLYLEVPRDTTIKVEIGIKRIVDGCENLLVWELDPEERTKLSFKEKMTACNELKVYGNDHFKKKRYQVARIKYRQALQILLEILSPIKEEADEINDLMYIIYINIAQCRIQEKEFRKAQQYLDEAVNLPLPNVQKLKAYYRLAVCHSEMGEVNAARKNIDMAKSIDTSNSDIDDLYLKLHQKILRDKEVEKTYSKRMFK